MGRKARELEELLAQREQEIAVLSRRVEELSQKVNEYRGREASIAQVMTRAQQAAEKINDEAEARRDDILAQTEIEVEEANEQARATIQHANDTADSILRDAKAKANEILRQAEDVLADSCSAARNFNAELRKAAQDASQQAERYAQYSTRLTLEEEITVGQPADANAPQNDSYEAPAAAEDDDTPNLEDLLRELGNDLSDNNEDDAVGYNDPSTLMKSIYTMENRDIPEPVATQDHANDNMDENMVYEDAQADEERVWTVDEVISEDMHRPQSPEDTVLEDLNAIIDEVLNS